MLFKVLSAAVFGIDAYNVEVEVDLTPKAGDGQVPMFTMVGLPDAAVRESRERIRAAIKKEGSSFDLPIAVGILGANGDLNREELSDTLLVGELSLDGRVRPIKGALPIAVAARANGVQRLLLPEENAQEAAVVTGLAVHPVASLRTVVELLNSEDPPSPLVVDTESMLADLSHYAEDFREVR